MGLNGAEMPVLREPVDPGWVRLSAAGQTHALIPSHVWSIVSAAGLSDMVEVAVHEAVMTVADVVRILGIEEGSILKSLLLAVDDGRHVLACVPGATQVDFHAVATHVGCRKVRPVPRADIARVSDVPVGALSPLSYDVPPVLVDSSMSALSAVHMGTGTREMSFRLRGALLRRLPYVTFAAIAKVRT
jgi:Cys-tRNA(Pro)/Cys-tRNA(Cys) deacylase